MLQWLCVPVYPLDKSRCPWRLDLCPWLSVPERNKEEASSASGDTELRDPQSSLQRETEVLFRIKDISHFLMQDIAFLSGGRGKDNAWIITFPENCNFRCIPEEVIAKVLTYLTSIARQNGSDSRFTIILDRRLDTWSSLKISLQKISASFPGNLHLVLVLRPTSFLQRTFTDIGFRFSQEDFMLKLPVVMLSSVSDLLTYIDDKQLTPELGGTLQYCHSEWIIFRNVRFVCPYRRALKDMAQMLQSFGTELAETELPDDIPSIEEILAIRSERYHLLKNDITAVTKEGKILLTNLEVPDTGDAVSSRLEHHQQISGDWQTINKLLTQVHDMEIAFDGFWEKHQLKMEQYLQLWKFEQDFQEDLLAKTRFVILHGHRLAASHHYALDLICQRCNELRYLSDILVNEIKAKRIQLSRTFKMHKLLQQARQCCDEGECLLANQEIEKFQSKEDAQKALQDIENFLEMAVPFINYDPETLQYEFDVILSPELKELLKYSKDCEGSVQLKEALDTMLDLLKSVNDSMHQIAINGYIMDEVGITEYVKGDNRKFEIWYAGKEEVYIVQAANVDVKMTWLKEIRNILLKQQELMTVKKREQHNQLTEQNHLSSQRNDERQRGAFIGTEETDLEHTSAMVEVGEAIASVRAEANTVWTEISSPTEISDEPDEWPSNYFYSSYDDNEEEERPLMVSNDILR
ncbi:proto-oncogene DBL isoform a [Camelus ferus]|nr:proto-oncogene DBL isoform a [Camelus ferus]